LGVPHPPELLVGLSIVAILVVLAAALVMWRRKSREAELGLAAAEPEAADRMNQAGLALVIGGALGNVVDRIARGYVVDFIHVKGWPIFNVADIAVVVGVGFFAIAGLLQRSRSPAVEPRP
jgi:signal peptidase II